MEFLVGVDLRGTSIEGLTDLVSAVGRAGVVRIVHDEGHRTFHPKVYLFASDDRARVAIGSGNLTEGGLFTNYEAALGLELDLTQRADRDLYGEISAGLDDLADASHGTCRDLTSQLMGDLVAGGYITPEALSRGDSTRSGDTSRPDGRLFGTRPVARPPGRRRRATAQPPQPSSSPTPAAAGGRGFVMTLQRTDVGFGQVTAGTSRRSPEIFIPLSARDSEPTFWGWPARYPGDPPTRIVRVRLGTEVLDVAIMYWPPKHEFRVRHEKLRSAGSIDDILNVETAPAGAGYDYIVEVIPVGSALYPAFDALCANTVGGRSRKRWGYY
jgi:hypothetical protein